MPAHTVFETQLKGLERIHQGKVRDLYALDGRHMLIVASDRLSAFDVVLPDPIPGKGRVLTQISNFWFGKTRHIAPNHLTGLGIDAFVTDPAERAMLEGRAVVVKRLQALPVEAVVRGYLIGSGWKDYQRSGGVCGIPLPAGLEMASRLPAPIFTPATKAAAGAHDENVDFDAVVAVVGEEVAHRVRELALALYGYAASYALERGIIIADTKFEFGLDEAGQVVLMDEALTPDSSRFWPQDTWRPGISPPSFDKQYVRDYLETLDWDKRAPGPRLPPGVIQRTAEKYEEALRRLTG
jgi:phosphoribosylaminoimidazole-succinocarboxamide synthase